MAFHVKLANLRGSGQYGFAVVGEASYQDELEELAGGRTEESAEHYCSAELIPEPDNPFELEATIRELRGEVTVLREMIKSGGNVHIPGSSSHKVIVN